MYLLHGNTMLKNSCMKFNIPMLCIDVAEAVGGESNMAPPTTVATKSMRLNNQGNKGANNDFSDTTYDYSDVTSFSVKAKVSDLCQAHYPYH